MIIYHNLYLNGYQTFSMFCISQAKGMCKTSFHNILHVNLMLSYASVKM